MIESEGSLQKESNKVKVREKGDVIQGQEPRNEGNLRRWTKQTTSPLKLPEGTGPADTLTLAQ